MRGIDDIDVTLEYRGRDRALRSASAAPRFHGCRRRGAISGVRSELAQLLPILWRHPQA